MAPPPAHRMTPLERRATFSLAAIYGLRLLGLSVILPVFAIYAVALVEIPGVREAQFQTSSARSISKWTPQASTSKMSFDS